MTENTSFSETFNYSAEHEEMPEVIKRFVCLLQRVCAIQNENITPHQESTPEKINNSKGLSDNLNVTKTATVAELLHHVLILTKSYQHLVEIAVDNLKWQQREQSSQNEKMELKNKEVYTNLLQEMEKELANFKSCVITLQTSIRSKSSQTVRFAILQELIAENEYRRRAVDQMRKVLEVARAVEGHVATAKKTQKTREFLSPKTKTHQISFKKCI